MSGSADLLGWLKDQGEDAVLLSAVQTALTGLGPISMLGLAVSGGSDSMAILHLMARLAPHAGWRIEAVTVDHRLRPEAAAEAAFVGRVCASLGVPHQVMAWNHGTIPGNLMDQARRARYGLLAEWAKSRGIGVVALGHTVDDQAETLLMGLARKAGLDGLTGMRAVWRSEKVVWTRPLLTLERAELRAYLARHEHSWRDDPSNEDAGYTRIKARKVLAALSPLGITPKALAAVADNLDSVRSALVACVLREAAQVARERGGAVEFDLAGFAALPVEVQRRLLIAAMRWLSGGEYPPREAGLNRVRSAIVAGKHATLSGCRILILPGRILIAREPRAIAALTTPTDSIWDHRWSLTGPHAPDLKIGALGAEGLRACKDWRTTGLQREVLVVSPAIWRGETLIAAPLAGMPNGWTATVSPSFPATILSH